MLSALKKFFGIRTIDRSGCTEVPLFSGYAYFSNRVPSNVSEKWVAHGGNISTGTTLDVRARYFFATDLSEPWVTKLLAKSVMVIHAGWIVHCVEEAFQVPISQYILDDRFVPEPPYKLTGNFGSPIYVPLEPEEFNDTEYGESGPTPLQTSDAPSTPTSMPRKRKREQAYFDSPSGSLVFSGFDKDGVPRRPRKLRKLRFDPSFSPGGGRSGRDAEPRQGLDWLEDDHLVARDDGESGKEQGEGGALHVYMPTVGSLDSPDRHFGTNERRSAALSVDTRLPVTSPIITIDRQEKLSSVRTIDFTNLPPSANRRRFFIPNGTKSGDMDMTLSIVKPTYHKIKSPKKISFANHAQVCVYAVSPRQPDAEDDVDHGATRRLLNEGFKWGPETKRSGKTWVPCDDGQGSDDSTAEATGTVARTNADLMNHSDDSVRFSGVDQSGNDTVTLTMEEVRAMRCRLLESAGNSGADNDSDRLATLFELGKTYRGMTFRHVW